jgi:uncharacterized protein (UPF0333 family)
MLKILNQKGQALLIVVLVMVVALTVGLAVVSRSVTNLRNSQQEVDSQKALSAAEAGIEQAIKSGVVASNRTVSTTTTYDTAINTVSGTAEFLLNGNNKVSQDDAMYIWLTPYSADSTKLFRDQDRWGGSLDIYWGNSPIACNNAALEIAVVSGNRAVPVVKRYTYDPCSPGGLDRASKNNFPQPTSIPGGHSISGITLYNKITIPGGITNGFLVRVVPLYTDSHIGVLGTPSVVGGPSLPSQGTIITSIGTTDKNVKRKLAVFQGYPELPAELFPFSLFWP